MKKIIVITVKYALVALITASIMFNANAQKQPQIQQISLLAPDNVKIDGKINEWPNPFLNTKKTAGFLQAYNSSSRVCYTVSNDENNLYFVIRGLGNMVSRKILSGGLTITISHLVDNKRGKAPDNVIITFPTPQHYKIVNPIMGTIANADNLEDEDATTNRKRIDSLDANANMQLSRALNEIKIIGVKEFPDQAVSVYNTEGLKAMAGFIGKLPVIEFAIPLKYLNLSVDNSAKFSYNIKINAEQEPKSVNEDEGPPKASDHVVLNAPKPHTDASGSYDSFYLFNTTDFWGVYTLAKKP